MLDITRFKREKRICLKHYGESYLLGIDIHGIIYAEEYYDHSYVAQYSITNEGVIITETDEDFGKNDLSPLDLAHDIIAPYHPLEHPLNYTGMRYRGMREQEKVAEWVQPLSIIEKMPLLQALQLQIPPMMIFGIAESRVLSESKFSDTDSIVCRRIKLLRALPQIQIDEHGLPYDYDSISFYVLHAYDYETETHPPLHEAIQNFADMTQPMDCIYRNARLVVANGGDNDNPSEVHIFQYHENEAQE